MQAIVPYYLCYSVKIRRHETEVCCGSEGVLRGFLWKSGLYAS